MPFYKVEVEQSNRVIIYVEAKSPVAATHLAEMEAHRNNYFAPCDFTAKSVHEVKIFRESNDQRGDRA